MVSPSRRSWTSIDDCPRAGIPHGTRYEIGNCGHAESNAIIFCAKHGISTEGADLYVNSSVCELCARTIIQAGIKRVFYIETGYLGTAILREAGIGVFAYNKEDVENA